MDSDETEEGLLEDLRRCLIAKEENEWQSNKEMYKEITDLILMKYGDCPGVDSFKIRRSGVFKRLISLS